MQWAIENKKVWLLRLTFVDNESMSDDVDAFVVVTIVCLDSVIVDDDDA